jgi:peptidoglycan hydrolase-like protein with peptidoglycan-binding domain
MVTISRRLANLTAALFFIGLSTLGADQTIQSVQQALKDQGFYYGQVNGEKNADTTAAIRRYQIRKGLQITGQLDPETLKSMSGSSNTVSSGSSHPPAMAPLPAVTPHISPSPALTSSSAPTPPSLDSQTALISPRYPSGPTTQSAEASQMFAGTPYERAPIEFQMRVVAQTQALLHHAGYYRGRVDGVYGLDTALAVRSFQSRSGILPTGQLDSGTLTALGLVPGPELQSTDQAPWDDGARPGDDAFRDGKGKWKIKKHHRRLRLFIVRPF